MRRVSVTDARRNLRALLDEVGAGEEIVLVRRGRPVGRLVSVREQAERLPSLAAFRRTIKVQDKPLGQELAAAREDERY